MTSYYVGIRDAFDRARERLQKGGGGSFRMKCMDKEQKEKEWTEARRIANQLKAMHKEEVKRVRRADRERQQASEKRRAGGGAGGGGGIRYGC